MKSITVRNKKHEYFIDAFRIILVLIILVLIYYYDRNLNASIIFGLIAFAGLVFSSKKYIEINPDNIKVVTKRLFKIFNKYAEYDRKEIMNIEYIPLKIHPLIIILPGFGGIRSARLRITKTNKKSEEFLITLTNTDLVILNDIIRMKK